MENYLAELDKAFKAWGESDWLSRHTAVTEEDFKKEPHRNKLNVMLSRVGHKSFTWGRLPCSQNTLKLNLKF